MRVLSLFSGIGAFEKALKNLGVECELVGYCEIDKYASKSYAAIHNVPESMNFGDITKVDESKLPGDIDLITYGFPCQDISLAGKQKGMFNEDGTKTRSGLFFEALRIIEAARPKVAIAENVKNLTSKKFTEQFKLVLDSLEEAGYNNYWQVLNAKNYGIPQNRERVFIVSIRKDIDNGGFKFPEGFPLELRLKDMLEDEVDESFYISSERTKTLQRDLINKDTLMLDVCQYKREGHPREYNEVAPTLSARDYKDPRLIQVAQMYGTERERIHKLAAFIPLKESARQCTVVVVATSPQQAAVVNELRIRKLTPKECFRLMGFDDEDFEKAAAVNSNTQLYKQAGNSIVVDVLENIFESLFEAEILKEN